MTKERWAMGSAVLTAFAASLCCVGPLLFVVLGLGAFSAASIFESMRPWLLGVTAVFLAVGFYRTYFKREQACAPGEACAAKPVNRAGRAGYGSLRLWCWPSRSRLITSARSRHG